MHLLVYLPVYLEEKKKMMMLKNKNSMNVAITIDLDSGNLDYLEGKINNITVFADHKFNHKKQGKHRF